MKKKAIPDRLTPEQRAEIEALAALPEDRIDTREIPEQREWSGARRGALFERARPFPPRGGRCHRVSDDG
jgi:hypothetical protein